VYVVLIASLAANCTIASNQIGPTRPISIDDDVEMLRGYAAPSAEDLAVFSHTSLASQAATRNQMLTARMYIADMEYHAYEARLTREMQDEGLLATAASLGLTTSATLIPVAQTKTLLSGIATGVTGLDKAYNEKELLSNTIQALQTQMRADRKAQAAIIYAKMFKDGANNTKIITPIAEYTLPMALSDADTYYQAGTLASSLIGLSKTVANAEQNADQAKSQAGPNPIAVSNAKTTASPLANQNPVLPQRTYVAVAATDSSYTTLRSLLFPNGATKADPELVAYVKRLVGANVAIGPILTTNPTLAPLRQRISACIVSHKAGHDCPDGSLSQLE
jgi:hypothetical protein